MFILFHKILTRIQKFFGTYVKPEEPVETPEEKELRETTNKINQASKTDLDIVNKVIDGDVDNSNDNIWTSDEIDNDGGLISVPSKEIKDSIIKNEDKPTNNFNGSSMRTMESNRKPKET